MEQWLVRREDNWIKGPFSKEEVQQMILSRQLKAEDEICSSDSYWIYLHEVMEVKQQLGIDVPRELFQEGDDDGETTTQVQEIASLTSEDRTDPNLEMPVQQDVTSVIRIPSSQPQPRKSIPPTIRISAQPESQVITRGVQAKSPLRWIMPVLMGLFLFVLMYLRKTWLHR